jgi:hypothetical protein
VNFYEELWLLGHRLANMQPVECMTAEQAAKELCCESVKALEKIAPNTKSD